MEVGTMKVPVLVACVLLEALKVSGFVAVPCSPPSIRRPLFASSWQHGTSPGFVGFTGTDYQKSGGGPYTAPMQGPGAPAPAPNASNAARSASRPAAPSPFYPGVQDSAGNYVAPMQGPGAPAPAPARFLDQDILEEPSNRRPPHQNWGPRPSAATATTTTTEAGTRQESKTDLDDYLDYEDYKADKERNKRRVMKLIQTGFHDEANEHEAKNAIELAQRLMGKHKDNLPQATRLKESHSKMYTGDKKRNAMDDDYYEEFNRRDDWDCRDGDMGRPPEDNFFSGRRPYQDFAGDPYAGPRRNLDAGMFGQERVQQGEIYGYDPEEPLYHDYDDSDPWRMAPNSCGRFGNGQPPRTPPNFGPFENGPLPPDWTQRSRPPPNGRFRDLPQDWLGPPPPL